LRINKIFENITTFPSSFNPYNDQIIIKLWHH
jgi:hypothetical protein